MTKLALLGAGGKMGMRLTANLKKAPEFDVAHVEISETGRRRLKDELDVDCIGLDEALDSAEVVVLGVPDNAIGKVAHQIHGKLNAGTLLVCLDAAAPYAGDLPERDDLAYFVTHPCHTPIFNDETDPSAQRDFFGGQFAKQNIVCALAQGGDSDYELGERVARTIYAPVMNAHRVTLKDMIILEPVLSETVAATCISVIREAMDEAVSRGVPAAAARDFLLGHMMIESAIFFNELPGVQLSDGAQLAVQRAKRTLFTPDWKDVFQDSSIKESVDHITGKV